MYEEVSNGWYKVLINFDLAKGDPGGRGRDKARIGTAVHPSVVIAASSYGFRGPCSA